MRRDVSTWVDTSVWEVVTRLGYLRYRVYMFIPRQLKVDGSRKFIQRRFRTLEEAQQFRDFVKNTGHPPGEKATTEIKHPVVSYKDQEGRLILRNGKWELM